MPRTVFITGGSRGIGAAAVRHFAEAGDRVAFTYLSSSARAAALSAETGALALCADAADAAATAAAVAAAERDLGSLDVLICNAGVARSGLLTDLSEEELHRLFAVNALGPMHAARAALPGMIRQKSGCILTVSSVWGLVGASCEVAYSATKAAVLGLTRALAKEVGPSGIRVNCVAPGVIDTEMNGDLTPADLDALRDETPLGRLGTPGEIAAALFWLASDEAAFLTGQVLSPNGGFVI